MGYIRGEEVTFGRLTASGEYVADPSIAPAAYSQKATAAMKSPEGERAVVQVINHPRGATGSSSEVVYKYLSGHLIAGLLDAKGTFTPHRGAIVIDFNGSNSDRYKYRIYNLPGTYLPYMPKKRR